MVPLGRRAGCVGQGERGECEKDTSLEVSVGTGIGAGGRGDAGVPLGTGCGGKVVACGELCVSWGVGVSAMEGKGAGAAEEDRIRLETSLPFRG